DGLECTTSIQCAILIVTENFTEHDRDNKKQRKYKSNFLSWNLNVHFFNWSLIGVFCLFDLGI
ncbi:MAG: hypothetical protein ACTSXP_02460, partial [Promethearchaeota archaeon]